MFRLTVQDMSCGHCASRVTKAVKGIDAKARVDIDLPAKTVSVETTADREVLHAALERAGYPATPA